MEVISIISPPRPKVIGIWMRTKQVEGEKAALIVTIITARVCTHVEKGRLAETDARLLLCSSHLIMTPVDAQASLSLIGFSFYLYPTNSCVSRRLEFQHVGDLLSHIPILWLMEAWWQNGKQVPHTPRAE